MDESHLIEAAKQGDATAFEGLVRQHQVAVFAYLRARLFEPADAEDLCQEVFLRSYQHLSRFDHTACLRPWLLGIARNVLREYVRSLRRSRKVAWAELCLALEEVAHEECGLYDEVLPHLSGCMDELGESARTSLQLHYGGRCKIAQIAERMHRSSDAVRLLMYRARKALKRCLDGKLAHESD